MPKLTGCTAGVFHAFARAFVVLCVLLLVPPSALAQDATDASQATIEFTQTDSASEESPQTVTIDDGSFEVLRELRATVLENGETYADWEVFSKEAQRRVADSDEATENLEELRRNLVTWRELFLDKEDINSGQITILDGQISALTPKINPSAPDTEVYTAELVKLRLESLKKERAVLRVPSLAAAQAFALSTGLIREIDRIINARQRSEFLVRGVSPVLPEYWGRTFEYVYDFFAIIPAETRVAWHKKDRNQTLFNNAPRILLYLILAGALFMRLGGWLTGIEARVAGQTNESLRQFYGLSLTFLKSFAPLLAVLLILKAVSLSSLLGSHGTAVIDGLKYLFLVFFIGRWLGHKVFPREDVGIEIIHLSPAQRIEGRLYSNALSIIFGMALLLGIIFTVSDPSKGVEAVLAFPLILAAGLISFRLAQLFRKGVLEEPSPEGLENARSLTFRTQVISVLSRVVMIPAIVGPVFATLGYYNAGTMITSPLIPALALLAFILILQQISNQIYDLFAQRFRASEESVIPVLIGFVLAIGSIPFFAIILGVRPAQIFDYWNLFLNGFTFGTTRISPSSLLFFVLVFVIGYAITRLVQGALRTSLLPKTSIDIGAQNAIVSGLGYVGIFLAGLAAILVAGIDLSSLAIVAGALSVGIGFGLQNIVSNFVSGIILLAERPISEGDWIETSDGQMGYVRDISVRSTRIETFDRTDVIIPNGDLVAGVVTNWTRGNSIGRLILPVGVSYDSDSTEVERILLDAANAHPMVLASPEPRALFRAFGASSLDFELRMILRDINQKLSVQSDLNHDIFRRLTQAGISIPFPQSDLWLRNPEALRDAQNHSDPQTEEPST